MKKNIIEKKKKKLETGWHVSGDSLESWVVFIYHLLRQQAQRAAVHVDPLIFGMYWSNSFWFYELSGSSLHIINLTFCLILANIPMLWQNISSQQGNKFLHCWLYEAKYQSKIRTDLWTIQRVLKIFIFFLENHLSQINSVRVILLYNCFLLIKRTNPFFYLGNRRYKIFNQPLNH